MVYKQVKSGIEQISDYFKKNDINVWIRPETTGKGTQWGDLDEIIRLSKEFDNVLPCVDFSHLHARFGGEYNTYDEFCGIFEKIGNEIGDYALKISMDTLRGLNMEQKVRKNI